MLHPSTHAYTVLDFKENMDILLCFSRQNWRVIFQVFQPNFGFVWLNSTVWSLVWEMNVTTDTEKCSQARYARTILKMAIFLVKSDTVEQEKISKIPLNFEAFTI